MDDCILGLDFMRNNCCEIDVKQGVLKCGQEELFMEGALPGNVYSIKKIVLPPRSETIVPVSLPRNAGQAHRCVLVERVNNDLPWKVARTLVRTTDISGVRVLNLCDREQIIEKGTLIGTCEEMDWLRRCQYISSGTPSKDAETRVTTLLEDCRSVLSPNELVKTKKLLLKYADVFSSNDADIGKTGLIQHKINTGEELPIRQRPRRLPVAREKEVETMIEGMVKDGVIEPSSSPWCSPVVLVKKKDGSMRFCVDYRRLNDVTKKDSYPLPRIDDTLDMLTGVKWFSTLDLKSGYWQVEIDTKDKEKTAFSTGKGLWQFKVMPFGLCNAPATFERLMELVLTGLIGDACLVYLDDIIIVGRTFEEHLQNLERVLMKIQSANLKLSPMKCSLFQRQVNFLGFVVSEEGIRIDPEKIAAVKDWPVPRDKTQVRAFLGLCSYYRRFVKNFADIAKPLHKLTEERRHFYWDESCSIAFQELKDRLCKTPILGYPDASKEFIVDTDASDIGLGGVLSQRNGDQEVVIAYFSKSLSKPERNYCVTRRELLAVVKSLQHFSKYLLGRKFHLRTDHAALKWLLQFKNPEGQVARWIELLQEYDFEIEHRSGKSHGNADALSRRPCPEDCNHCTRQESKEEVSVRMLRTDHLSN
ncbi:unnamed protein product [Parnassius apollo]|uniref:RNA-directed DNA polymerase n=1 Tax=Parnassius apollo TaxID=110799 RepID=A0A8S3VY51_PARAO|nr:unnamed protein product [Parnassius apollo]